MFNPDKLQGNMEDGPDAVKSKTPLVSIDKPKSDEFMSMMALMQVEYAKINRERNNWLIEKTKLETRIQVLEGKLRTFSTVNNELIGRMRLLEISLLESRNQKREDQETVVPSTLHDLDMEKMMERKARIGGSFKRGRHLLNQYIREVMSVEDHIKKTGEAGNIVKNLFERYRGKAYSEIFDVTIPPCSKISKPMTKATQSFFSQKNEISSGGENKSIDFEFTMPCKGKIVPRGQSKLNSKASDIDSLFDFLTVDNNSLKSDSESDKLDSEELNRDIAQAMNDVEALAKELDSEQNSTSTDDTSIGSLESIDVEMNEIDESMRTSTVHLKKGGNWNLNFNLKGHLDALYSVKFHPRHEMLVTTSEDGVVCLYDVKKMNNVDNLPTAYLRGHDCPALSCTFDEDGLYLYSGDKNGKIIVWNPVGDLEILEKYVTNGEPICDLSHSKKSGMVLSASADGVCRLWKPDSLKPVSTMKFSEFLFAASYYPMDHSKLLISTKDTIFFYDVIKGSTTNQIASEGKMSSSATNPKQPIFATGWENKIKIMDVRQAKYVHEFVAHPFPVTSMCYTASGDSLISGSTNGAINVWNNTHECTESMQSHRTKACGGVLCLDQHSLHPYLASGGVDDVAKVYVYS